MLVVPLECCRCSAGAVRWFVALVVVAEKRYGRAVAEVIVAVDAPGTRGGQILLISPVQEMKNGKRST